MSWFWLNRLGCDKKTKVDSLSDEEESDKEDQQIFDEALSKVDNNKSELLQIIKKPEDHLQISSEEGVMKVDNKIVIHEKITID